MIKYIYEIVFGIKQCDILNTLLNDNDDYLRNNKQFILIHAIKVNKQTSKEILSAIRLINS